MSPQRSSTFYNDLRYLNFKHKVVYTECMLLLVKSVVDYYNYVGVLIHQFMEDEDFICYKL